MRSGETMTAQQLIDRLGLEPLPEEGGYYRETFRSPRRLPAGSMGPGYEGPRDALTAIYFLVTRESPSAWHVLPSDEVFLWHAGASVAMLRLPPDGPADPVVLGVDLSAGERPQAVVPGGVWQGCRVADRAEVDWALLSCLVAPGFDFADFRVATPEEVAELAARFAEHAEEVKRLAPK
ncbi:cupin domain-containing protein [Botrimarina sp.]|uniref:cupin domain-containing protein n=1 Tax=Botrimarina sp. TaxID=2795802 RepID=UPI0032EE4738